MIGTLNKAKVVDRGWGASGATCACMYWSSDLHLGPVLTLTGPTGTAKTATVHAFARDLNGAPDVPKSDDPGGEMLPQPVTSRYLCDGWSVVQIFLKIE